MMPDGIDQGLQQGSGFANPIGEGGAVEIEAFTVEALALAEKRQMIGIFADQNVGQQTRAGTAAFDGARGQRGLHEAFTAGASQARPDDLVLAWRTTDPIVHGETRARVLIDGSRCGPTPGLVADLRCCSAIEAEIGHINTDGRLASCPLKGTIGDALFIWRSP